MDKRMKMYVDLLKQSKDLDERLKKVKSSMAEIEPLVLEYFVDNGVDRITIEGVTLYPKSQIWASVPELALDDLNFNPRPCVRGDSFSYFIVFSIIKYTNFAKLKFMLKNDAYFIDINTLFLHFTVFANIFRNQC
jgi:hypothetical protein